MAVGPLRKMRATLTSPVQYSLPVGESIIPLNDLINRSITLRYLQHISCIECGRKTKTSFNQGFCFPCFQRLAQCDSCIVSPEKCHFDQGTCREPDWAESHCMQDHILTV